MFKVDANSLEEYFEFDHKRKQDLLSIDQLIRSSSPGLTRWFYPGAADGAAGMKFRMIGYGKFQYAVKSGKTVDWPIIGMALQKNYISLYIAVTKNGRPIVDDYAGKLGELKTGKNNFSFISYDQLNIKGVKSLLANITATIEQHGKNALQYSRTA
jgi:hypothetical protein